jgi:hypothetical protein
MRIRPPLLLQDPTRLQTLSGTAAPVAQARDDSRDKKREEKKNVRPLPFDPAAHRDEVID